MNQFNPFFTNPDTFLARIFSEKNLKFVAHVVNPINEPTEVRFYLDSLTLNPKGVSLKITPVSKYIIGVRETGFNFYIIDSVTNEKFVGSKLNAHLNFILTTSEISYLRGYLFSMLQKEPSHA